MTNRQEFLLVDYKPHWAIYDYTVHWLDITRCWMGDNDISARHNLRSLQMTLAACRSADLNGQPVTLEEVLP